MDAAKKIKEIEKIDEDLDASVAMALEYEGNLMTAGFIKELHDLATPKNKHWANNFHRRKPLGFDYEYPVYEDMEFQTQILCDEFNKRQNIEKFIYDFAQLHPFLDGNGRTARIIYLALTKEIYTKSLMCLRQFR